MATSTHKEEVIRLPLELVTASAGFALDLGGSALKLLYRSKEDFNGGKPLIESEDELGPMRLGLFARESIEGLIQYIIDHCDLTDHDDRTIYSAGMGGNMFKGILEERLNIKLHNSPEFPCLSQGLKFVLEKIPKSQVYYPVLEDAKNMARKKYKEYSLLVASAGVVSKPDKLEEIMSRVPDDKPSYPMMIVLCGSAFLMFKVHEDGRHDFIEALPLGGRFFLGCLRLLVGETLVSWALLTDEEGGSVEIQDHDKLVDMMTSSDGRSVDMYTSEMTSAGSKDSYSVFNDNDINLFPMGKANYQPRDKIKDGDVVHSFTSVVCTNLVQMVHLAANKTGLKKALFCGNFVNSEFVKSQIWSDLFTRNAMGPKEDEVDIEFLRFGGHLGALGAFLIQKEDMVPPTIFTKETT